MSDMTTAAPGGGDAPITPVTITVPVEDKTPISIRDAARALSTWRADKKKQPEASEPAPQEPAAEPPQELAETPNDDQPQADPVETTEQQPDPALPPIEPPRSWTKDEKEEFLTYPREAQEKIARREQERDAAIRRSQNEAAEKLKALSGREQEAEKARQQYEAALPQLLQMLQDETAGQFADIRTPADVAKLATDDPFRYLQWDAHQKKVASVQMELRAANERQTNEYRKQWFEYAAKQDAELIERAPEMKNPERARKIADGAVSVLKVLGFNEQELGQLWNGEASLSLRDHRLQLLLLDGVKYREGQELAKKVAAKPLPPVQKPGVAVPKGAAEAANVQNLSKKLDQSGSLKDAVAFISAKRAAAKR